MGETWRVLPRQAAWEQRGRALMDKVGGTKQRTRPSSTTYSALASSPTAYTLSPGARLSVPTPHERSDWKNGVPRYKWVDATVAHVDAVKRRVKLFYGEYLSLGLLLCGSLFAQKRKPICELFPKEVI